jgi:hypothetical protein
MLYSRNSLDFIQNTPPDTIETFEGIETAVRDQVLEHVSPKITFFCRDDWERQRGKHGQ